MTAALIAPRQTGEVGMTDEWTLAMQVELEQARATIERSQWRTSVMSVEIERLRAVVDVARAFSDLVWSGASGERYDAAHDALEAALAAAGKAKPS